MNNSVNGMRFVIRFGGKNPSYLRTYLAETGVSRTLIAEEAKLFRDRKVAADTARMFKGNVIRVVIRDANIFIGTSLRNAAI
jgi:hypothetical protein